MKDAYQLLNSKIKYVFSKTMQPTDSNVTVISANNFRAGKPLFENIQIKKSNLILLNTKDYKSGVILVKI
ncbi:hypothetical protein CK934_22355 [Chitinophaga sp. MD30]|nr:hypothetical protein CK934_22355 [Chitinophaga sp. MD30]